MMTMPSETVLPTVAMADDDDNDDSPPVDPADDDAVASLLGMSDNAEVDVPVPGAASRDSTGRRTTSPTIKMLRLLCAPPKHNNTTINC